MRMITNLFSIFDPSSIINLKLNWISSLLWILILPPLFFLFPSRISLFWTNLISYLYKEISILLPLKINHVILLFLSLFTFIVVNNRIGLLPQIFTSSRHLIFTLTLALPIWLRFYTYGWIKKFKEIMAHLVPNRTPSLLIPFIIIIETIRRLIRPLTLAVRLAANIIAGHLLIALLRNYASIFDPSMILTVVRRQLLLLALETAVAVIQAYVFTVLCVLYIREI